MWIMWHCGIMPINYELMACKICFICMWRISWVVILYDFIFDTMHVTFWKRYVFYVTHFDLTLKLNLYIVNMVPGSLWLFHYIICSHFIVIYDIIFTTLSPVITSFFALNINLDLYSSCIFHSIRNTERCPRG